MEREKANYAVRALCRVLGVSPSGYDAWRTRGPAARVYADAPLTDRVAAIHGASRGTYGAPRIRAELAATGTGCGRTRVARLMRQADLVGCHRRRAWKTTRRDPTAEPAPDLVGRACAASMPDRLWVADSTDVPTADGFLYLAVVLDAFSRRVVGWSMADHMWAEVEVGALRMALGRRPAWSTTPTTAANTPQRPSRPVAASPTSAAQWARSVTASTTRWRRASSPPWSARSSRTRRSAPTPRRASPSSRTLSAFTIGVGTMWRWAISRPTRMRGVYSPTNDRLAIPCP